MNFDQTAECKLLGAILARAEVLDDIDISADDFYIGKNKNVYKAIKKLYDKCEEIDIVSVNEELGGNSLDYLVELQRNVETTHSAKNHARIVKNHATRRKLIQTAQTIMGIASDTSVPIERASEEFEKYITSADNSTQDGLTPIGEILPSVFENIVNAQKNGGKVKGVRTGFHKLDFLINGLESETLTIIGARPAMGKSTFAQNIIENISAQGKATALFSLEMSKEMIATRIVASQSGVTNRSLSNGMVSADEYGAVTELMDILAGRKLFIGDNATTTLDGIIGRCRKFKRQYKEDVGAIVIDYLQLINSGAKTSMTRNDEVGMISRRLKLLAMELKCPIVVLSQLSRKCEDRQDKRPSLSDLRESGSIEQDADNVLFIYRDEVYNEKTAKKHIAEIEVAKCRNGSCGTVELGFKGEYLKFMNLEDLMK